MNLKKAFQYQKALKNLELQLVHYLLDEKLYLKITEVRHKSDVNSMSPDYHFTDETNDLSDSQYGKYDYAKVFAIYQKLVEWRTNLSKGIAEAKARVHIGPEGLSYDAAIVYVNDQRDVLCKYGQFATLEPKETKSYSVMPVATNMGDANVQYNMTTTEVPVQGLAEMAAAKRLALHTELDNLSDEIEATALSTNLPNSCILNLPLNIRLEELYQNFEKYC